MVREEGIMMDKGDFFSRKRKEIGIISVVAIIISSFSLFFYQQNITEQNIKDSIFNQYKNRQIESTQIISERIESDLNLIMSILQGISDSVPLQEGVLYGRSEEHTSELQSPCNLVCRLLLEKKNRE